MFTGITLCLISIGIILVGNNKDKLFGVVLLVLGINLIINNGKIEVL